MLPEGLRFEILKILSLMLNYPEILLSLILLELWLLLLNALGFRKRYGLEASKLGLSLDDISDCRPMSLPEYNAE